MFEALGYVFCALFIAVIVACVYVADKIDRAFRREDEYL